MNKKPNKLLYCLLIIMMVIAPLRSAFSMQQSHCDMDTPADSMSMAADMDHDMSMMLSTGSQQPNEHQCCCCEDGCLNACDMNLGSSLLLQSTSHETVLINTSKQPEFSFAIIIRALSPPSRPPAKLS